MKTKDTIKIAFSINSTERVWQMPFFAALGVGVVLSISAYYDRIDLGLISMLGVLAFVRAKYPSLS